MKINKQSKPFAKKSFGQNFLVDQNYINKIISALNPKQNETIIEIGAGRGALTEKLIESGAEIIAIELDRDLIPLLNNDFGGNENFKLVENDALKVDFSALSTQHSGQNTKLVANLPYYISTAILQHLIQYRNEFSELVLMLQREVVERITAEIRNTERGFLTVLVEAYFEAEKLFDVPPNAFRPAPKIWSSIVRLKPKAANDISSDEDFRKIVSCGFRQKRKTILNNLKNAPEILYKEDLKEILEKHNIETKRRAETLTLEEWKILAEILSVKNE
jgi:16S rRNA (adenine1518-N6/adenine1519-N6)-dimethyltransferase